MSTDEPSNDRHPYLTADFLHSLHARCTIYSGGRDGRLNFELAVQEVLNALARSSATAKHQQICDLRCAFFASSSIDYCEIWHTKTVPKALLVVQF